MSTEKMEVSEEIAENNEYDGESLFTSLPVELFLHICTFLTVKDIADGLTGVCKRFNEILNDENIWKTWIQRGWEAKYPIINPDCNFDWKAACYEIEKEQTRWSKQTIYTERLILNDIHISSVDAVVFIDGGETCVSGARDRSLVVWSPMKSSETQPVYSQRDSAHEGWIWRLAYQQGSLYSCSWDTTVKVWAVREDFRESHRFKCSSPVLAMSLSNEGIIFSGEYGKTVHGFDPRSGAEPVITYAAHSKAVLSLGNNDREVVSGSEDRSLVIWDKRGKRVRHKIELGKSCYPNCCSMDNTHVFIGDNRGSVHVLGTQNETVTRAGHFTSLHNRPVSAIKHSLGYLMIGSQDGTLKICLPSNPPRIINTLHCNGSVGSFDYSGDVLAVGASTALEFWIPDGRGVGAL